MVPSVSGTLWESASTLSAVTLKDTLSGLVAYDSLLPNRFLLSSRLDGIAWLRCGT